MKGPLRRPSAALDRCSVPGSALPRHFGGRGFGYDSVTVRTWNPSKSPSSEHVGKTRPPSRRRRLLLLDQKRNDSEALVDP